MTKKIILAALVILFSLSSSFKVEDKIILKVEVTGFEKTASNKIWISVFSKNDFLKKSLQTKSVLANGDKVIVEFALPPGDYAVSTYFDSNKNDKLDRYFFGKPKEPYGFSNNVNTLGPPSFDKCKFKIVDLPKIVSIELID